LGVHDHYEIDDESGYLEARARGSSTLKLSDVDDEDLKSLLISWSYLPWVVVTSDEVVPV